MSRLSSDLASDIVRDHGRGRVTPIDEEHRRRGIPLMQACMETMTIGQAEDDPVVHLGRPAQRSRPPAST